MVRVTVWIRSWYGFDTILVRIWYGFGILYRFLMGWLPQKEAETAQGHFLRISPGFLWFWHCCKTILIRFWHSFDMIFRFWYGSGTLASAKGNRNSPGKCVFSWIFVVLIRFWYDFDTILIRFCYDFDTILLRFCYDFDTILIRFWIWFDGLASTSTILTDSKNHKWNYIKIVTETISKS